MRKKAIQEAADVAESDSEANKILRKAAIILEKIAHSHRTTNPLLIIKFRMNSKIYFMSLYWTFRSHK